MSRYDRTSHDHQAYVEEDFVQPSRRRSTSDHNDIRISDGYRRIDYTRQADRQPQIPIVSHVQVDNLDQSSSSGYWSRGPPKLYPSRLSPLSTREYRSRSRRRNIEQSSMINEKRRDDRPQPSSRLRDTRAEVHDPWPGFPVVPPQRVRAGQPQAYQYQHPYSYWENSSAQMPKAVKSNNNTYVEHDLPSLDPYGFTFQAIEEEGLSISLQVEENRAMIGDQEADSLVALAWKQPRTELPRNESSCELFEIHAIEHSVGSGNSGKLTLICPGGPKQNASHGPIQLWWLHIQRSAQTFGVMQRLVSSCPYLSKDLAAVTFALLADVKDKFAGVSDSGPYLEPGAVQRAIGKYFGRSDGDKKQATEAVIFLSSPYIKSQARSSSLLVQDPDVGWEEYGTRTLMQSLYGYAIEDDERPQVVEKIMGSTCDGVLQLDQMWSLMIGSNILITMSGLTAAQMGAGTVPVDVRSSVDGQVIPILLVEDGRLHHSVIDVDYAYVDLLRHCVLLIGRSTSYLLGYELLEENGDILTAARWPQLVALVDNQCFKFHIRHKYHKVHAPMPRDANLVDPERMLPIESRYKPLRVESTLSRRQHPNHGSVISRSPIRRDRRRRPESSGSRERTSYQVLERVPGRRAKRKANPVNELRDTQWRSPKQADRDDYLRSQAEDQSSQEEGKKTSISPGSNMKLRAREIATTEKHGSSTPSSPRNKTSHENIEGPISPSLEEIGNEEISLIVLSERPRSVTLHDSGSYLKEKLPITPGALEAQHSTALIPLETDIAKSREEIDLLGSKGSRETARSRSIQQIPHKLDWKGWRNLADINAREETKDIVVVRKSPRRAKISKSKSLGVKDFRTGGIVINDVLLEEEPSAEVFYLGESTSDNNSEDQENALLLRERSDTGKVTSPQGTYSSRHLSGDPNTAMNEAISGVIPAHYVARKKPGSAQKGYREEGEEIEEGGEEEGKEKGENVDERNPEGYSDEVYHSTNSEGQSSQSSTFASIPEPLDTATSLITLPFLAWQLRRTTSKHTANSDSTERDVIGIMSTVNKALSTGETKTVYSRSYRCSREELEQRHPFLAQKLMNPPENRRPNGAKSDDGTNDADDTGEGSEVPAKQTKATPSVPNLRARRHHYDYVPLTEQLSEASQDLLNAFISNKGSTLGHHIPARFWGAVDTTFRQITWGETDHAAKNNRYVVIYKPHSITALKGKEETKGSSPQEECFFCQSETVYSTVSKALKHVHTHAPLYVASNSDQPYEDPYFVWVRRIEDEDGIYEVIRSSIYPEVKEFVRGLNVLRKHAKELHGLVFNARSRNARDNKPNRPLLAASLVTAFTEIIRFYVLQVKVQSYQIRCGADPSYKGERSDSRRQRLILRDKLHRIENRRTKTYQDACRALQEAKQDIVLLESTNRHDKSLGIESVSGDFLVMSLIANMQNREAAVIPDLIKQSNSQSGTDYVELYRKYVTNLQYQASKRPQRRLFLDIGALQEELTAIANVGNAQRTLLEQYLRLLDPRSLRITNRTRIGQFATERALGRKQQRILQMRDKNVQDLVERTDYLRDRIKQTIEIVEEGHGKAIRVFTIVTLFFLPLSFVSSFMGMNTRDIREMQQGQTLFWSTGLPITAVVLLAAVMYAYYGDQVGDWLEQQMSRSSGGSRWEATMVQQASTFSRRGRRGRKGLIKQETIDTIGF